MDFVFHCPACHGPLIAARGLHGHRVQCAHCACGTEAREGRAVTESLVSSFLDLQPAASPRLLRRVRPAPKHTSAGASHSHPPFPRMARISGGARPPAVTKPR